MQEQVAPRPTAAEVAERLYTEHARLLAMDPDELFIATWSELSDQDREREIEAVALVMRHYGWLEA